MEWYNSNTKMICERSFWQFIHATTLLHGWLELARDQDGVDPVVTLAIPLFVLAAVFRLWQYNKFKYNVISLNLLTD